MIYKIFYILILFSLSLSEALAQSTGGKSGGRLGTGGQMEDPGKLANPLKLDSLIDVFNTFLGFVRDIFILIAGFFVFYSGFLYVTARGNKQQLEKAKSMFLYSLLGITIILAASGIAAIIRGTISNVVK